MTGRSGELLGVAVVVARSAGLAGHGDTTACDLAGVACAAASHRLDGLWARFAAEGGDTGTKHARAGAALLGADAVPDDVAGNEASDGVEATVVAVWCELFGRKSVGRQDDFYELGGHSLLAIRMTARLRDELGVKVPVRTVLENPTVAGLVDELGLRDGAS